MQQGSDVAAVNKQAQFQQAQCVVATAMLAILVSRLLWEECITTLQALLPFLPLPAVLNHQAC